MKEIDDFIFNELQEQAKWWLEEVKRCEQKLKDAEQNLGRVKRLLHLATKGKQDEMDNGK